MTPRSTATRPMGPASSSSASMTSTSTRAAGPSRRRLPAGKFAKDRFDINLINNTVTCPAGVTVTIRRGADGGGIAYFSEHCSSCPLRGECTDAAGGPHHPGRTSSKPALARARQRQDRPRLANRLPGQPTQGRTQARPPDAPPPRRPPSTCPRTTQGRRRLQPPRRRRQPRAPRHARTSLHDHRMGGHRMNQPARTHQRPPWRPDSDPVPRAGVRHPPQPHRRPNTHRSSHDHQHADPRVECTPFDTSHLDD